MMPARLTMGPTIPDNPLGLSWHDSAWIPVLNTSNVMDYFSERTNPFYDRTCNNEIVKMQRLNPEQLQNMTGLEYVLLHVQEPILYVIRKQHRHSPAQTTSLADYYIIAGVVYQAPDLASVLNSRLLSAVHHLQSSFEEASSFSRYHPSKGYSWDFKRPAPVEKSVAANAKQKETEKREEPSSLFQRQRVDMLLVEMLHKYPLPSPAQTAQQQQQPKQQLVQITTTQTTTTTTTTNNHTTPGLNTTPTTNTINSITTTPTTLLTTANIKLEPDINNTIHDKTDIKQEKGIKPPDKKPRLT